MGGRFLLLVVLALMLAGCVSVEVSVDDLPGQPDRATFLADASAICAERNAALRSLRPARSRRHALDNVARAAAAEHHAIAGLAALKPPPSLARDMVRLLAAERRLVVATERWRLARQRDNVYELTRATNAAQLAGREVTLTARRLGLENCTSS